jgi:hypothetical protein
MGLPGLQISCFYTSRQIGSQLPVAMSWIMVRRTSGKEEYDIPGFFTRVLVAAIVAVPTLCFVFENYQNHAGTDPGHECPLGLIRFTG